MSSLFNGIPIGNGEFGPGIYGQSQQIPGQTILPGGLSLRIAQQQGVVGVVGGLTGSNATIGAGAVGALGAPGVDNI